MISKMKNSKFFCGLRMVYKNNFSYLDHNYNIYKDITIQNTYVIVLSSKAENNFLEIINNYCFKKN